MEDITNVPKAMIEGLSSMNRDELTQDELAAIDYANSQKEKEEAEYNKTMDSIDMLIDAISSDSSNPLTRYDIEDWRSRFGVVYISSVTGDDTYIWRTINRIEYKKLAANGSLNEKERAEESIVRKCLLYPEPKDSFITTSPAGVVSTLSTQILYTSGFVSDNEALRYIKEI